MDLKEKQKRMINERKDSIFIDEDDVWNSNGADNESIALVWNYLRPDFDESELNDISFMIRPKFKRPLRLRRKKVKWKGKIYTLYPNEYDKFTVLMYDQTGQFVNSYPVYFDGDIGEEEIKTNPIYREVWSPRTLGAPGEPIGEMVGTHKSGNIWFDVTGVDMPDASFL